MKNFLSILFSVLACTSWLYPILFVHHFLICIKGIFEGKEDEEYRKSFIISAVSLICISISPFVITLLVTA